MNTNLRNIIVKERISKNNSKEFNLNLTKVQNKTFSKTYLRTYIQEKMIDQAIGILETTRRTLRVKDQISTLQETLRAASTNRPKTTSECR